MRLEVLEPDAGRDLQVGAAELEAEPNPLAEVQEELDELAVDEPHVGIVAGDDLDLAVLQDAVAELDARAIRHEVRVFSRPRETSELGDYARNARLRGLRVLIAGSAEEVELAGLVAAHTELPVLGVPLAAPGSDGGGALEVAADAAGGRPVAWVAAGAARDAAVLAARILAT